ncbi:MAG: thioredoxin family protein [Pseudomonadota bacterium]
MVALNPPSIDEQFSAIDFNLLAPLDNKNYTLADVSGENGLLVMFICNHCPFVKSIIDKIVRDTNELKNFGINSVAIMANDVNDYPEDKPENMVKLANEKNFSFPYLYDKDQTIAKAYGAVCTPDFFGFGKDLKLKYRGRLDDSGMNKDNANAKRELFNAMVEVVNNNNVPAEQIASIGCSIKWIS